MKKIILPIALSVFSLSAYSQAWIKGGNNPSGNPFVLGSNSNDPIGFETNGTQRMRLNGTLTTTINSVNQNVSGFFGIAPSGYFANNTPVSMLHLYGPNNSPYGIGGGWRRWMQTGIFINENSDAIYIGMKPEVGTNRSDAVIGWNDDAGSGEDKLRFIFTAANQNGNGTGNNPIDGLSVDGYEFMRMSSSPNQTNSAGYRPGNIGIGPVFTNIAPPQNRLHINAEGVLSNWFQMSIQNSTGQTNTDGLKMGILADNSANIQNGNAFIYNQELRHIIFSTGNAVPTAMGTTNERVRITAIQNPTTLSTGTYGINNPGGLPLNRTRVAISEEPGFPIVRPLSLLHLGYDVGVFQPSGTLDGWRPWMDIGMFVSNGTDNTYIGLKNEGAFDRNDAVLNWGDNGVAGFSGPDNFRFIFTSKVSPTNNASGVNGLEGMRMTPTTANGIFTGIGGDPATNPYTGASINPTQTLEVNSWGATSVVGGSSGLRFTNLNNTSPTTPNTGNLGVLSVNSTGDVIYVPGGGGGGIGNYCTAPQNPLTSNFEVPLNNNNYYFTDPAGTLNDKINFVKIGGVCSAPVIAKLQIHRGLTTNTQFRNAASLAINEDIALSTAYLGYGYGFYGQSIGQNRFNAGIAGSATKGYSNIGGLFLAEGLYANPINENNYGVQCFANKGNTNYGVFSRAVFGGTKNYGGYFEAQGATANNFGIRAKALPVNANNFAGYFDGMVSINGGISSSGGAWTSDSRFKTNINPLRNTLATINQLTPKSFYFDTLNTEGFNFPSEKQYGFIAQDVETVLPELVISTTKPADYDTLGNIVQPAITYKALNYNAFIGILAKGVQELDSSLTSISSKGIKAKGTPIANKLTKFTSADTIANSQILDDGTNVGINTSTPNTKLEINSGIANTSGLTFTNLTLASPVIAPNGKVLSVNSSGQVILTEGINSGTGVIAPTLPSDQQFKTNVDSISNAVSLIKQLKPRSFYFDTTNVYGLSFNNQKQYGLIAQDVEQILPELVSNTTKTATYDTAGTLLTPAVTYKVLNYNAFTAITLKGIQELSNENTSLKTKTNNQDSIIAAMQNQLTQLMIMISNCCSSNENRSMQSTTNIVQSQSSVKQTDVALSNKNVIVLDQNVPNPFAEQTSITYYLPENVKRAQILFFEQSGKIIKTVDLTEKGKGVLNVFANDLSNGIYTYSLIVDGQTVETKKMVKQ